MKVLYDITTLAKIFNASGVDPAGIYRATESLGVALEKADGLDMSLCSARTELENALSYIRNSGAFRTAQFAFPAVRTATSQAIGSSSNRLSESISKDLLDYWSQNYNPDAVYNPEKFDVYHLNWRAALKLPVDAHPAVVVSVFDVIALKSPEWFVKPGQPNPIADYLRNLIKSVRPQHTITVNAECVKSDLIRLFPHLQPGQIEVVPLGVSDRFGPIADTSRLEEVRAKYNVPAGYRYVLCVNTLEPRKNMQAAIKAFAHLVQEHSLDKICLVLAGSKGWLDEDLRSLVGSLDLKKTPVIVTGFVADSDLTPLYCGAEVFCYPSLDEGFGLPVLEAMKCGIPVVASNTPALTEVAGSDAVFVHPGDIPAIADALYAVLSDKALSSSLRERGMLRASYYSWERSARNMAAVYGRAVERRRSVTKGGGPANAGSQIIDLQTLRNRYKGHPVFLIGSGALPGSAPFNLLEGELTMCLDEAYESMVNLRYKPTFFLSSKSDLTNEEARKINGLTGSTFLIETLNRDLIRTGEDVIYYRRAEVEEVHSCQFAHDAASSVSGPGTAIATSIQLAYHMGCDPIYLLGCEYETDSETKEMTDWHRLAREEIEGQGRRIFSMATDHKSDRTYDIRTSNGVFSGNIRPVCARADHATLDETEVISSIFGGRKRNVRTMIDVGAHRGHSAKHFVDKGWRIFCFEPDRSNREDHLVKRFRDAANVTIDSRAVSDKAAKGASFFASEESSGISALHAFRDTHEETGRVDVTTIAEIMEEYHLEEIDFLKIDVEGYDFSVLKGVPWDRVKPAVIECEYEDAKTLRLGHRWQDIADYLIERGYTVYVSEWHPIIRYGIAHDWRRIVPYPGIEIPGSSWGNILAFLEDPGYDLVSNAFSSHVRSHAKPVAPAAPRNANDKVVDSKPLTGASSARPAAAIARPVYAPFGEWVRAKSPKAFTALRLLRLALAGLWRRKLWVGPVACLIGVGVVAGFVVEPVPYKILLWTAAAFAVAMFSNAYLALRIFQHASRLSAESLHHKSNLLKLGAILKSSQSELKSLRTDVRKTSAEMARLRGNANDFNRELEFKIEQTEARVVKAEERAEEINVYLTNYTEDVKSSQSKFEQKMTDEITAGYDALERWNDESISQLHAQFGTLKSNTETAITNNFKSIAKNIQESEERVQSELERRFVDVGRLRHRIASSEQQIGKLRYPNAPRTLVFFGHHKCASRFFREEVFGIVAEATAARTRRYKIENPPFHYSAADELDLCNMNFDGLGEDGRDIVLFANATHRSLSRVKEATEDWKGIRIIRDPRQVLVSSYFHHKGDHDTESPLGWVWDQLAHDKPILQELPEEEGLLYELDNISSQVIQDQILGEFDDKRILTIRIEDFSSDPSHYLKVISEFLGITDLTGLNFNRKFENLDSGPWQNHFTSRLREVFKDRYGEALIKLGYADDLYW